MRQERDLQLSWAAGDSRKAPRSRRYDGAFYARFVDPMNAGLHEHVAREVRPGAKVLDVGCGTGALAARLAATALEVVGIELSPAMIAYADGRATMPRNVSLVQGDAVSVLSTRPAGAFDAATMVLVLHEMPAEARLGVLREATRVARRLLCVDYRAPMPLSLARFLFHGLELAAGGEHFRAFRDFNRRGGIEGIATGAGLSCRRVRLLGSALEMMEVRR